MQDKKEKDQALGFLFNSLNKRIKAGIIHHQTPFTIEAPKPNKYGYIPKERVKNKKGLREKVQRERLEKSYRDFVIKRNFERAMEYENNGNIQTE